MSETANDLFRDIARLQDIARQLGNGLQELRAKLAALGVEDSASAPHLPRTGYRLVRGTHGVSYVSDPNGVDPLPLGWEAPR